MVQRSTKRAALVLIAIICYHQPDFHTIRRHLQALLGQPARYRNCQWEGRNFHYFPFRRTLHASFTASFVAVLLSAGIKADILRLWGCFKRKKRNHKATQKERTYILGAGVVLLPFRLRARTRDAV